MTIDIDNALVNLKFCPCKIVMKDGKSVLGTRCWDWISIQLKKHPQFKKTFERARIVNITEGNLEDLTVWSCDKEEFITLKIKDIVSCYLDKYLGQMYLE